MTKIILDHDAFLRRIHRQNKDKDWESDIRSYTFWCEHLKKYPASAVAIEMVAKYEAKYPQLKEKQL